MLIDSHCHLDSKDLYKDFDGVLSRSKEVGVDKVICVGCEEKSWDRVVDICNQNNNIYGALGLHPHDARFWNVNIKSKLLKSINSSKKIKAYGEIGLDYYYLDKNKDIEKQKKKQKEVFREQLELAKFLDLPVIVHTREAEEDTLNILNEYQDYPVVIHCFSGTVEFAQKMIELGFYLSFTGIITFDKTNTLDGIIKSIPLDRIMIETDSPYLAPIPKRGKINEPSYLKHIFDYLVSLLEVNSVELETQLFRNTETFFRL